MPTIRNKTRKPLSVPLPGGKRLHLVPGKDGQVAPKALEHPPLLALVEAGELEITEGGKRTGSGGSSGKTGLSSSQGHQPSKGVRHTGDR